MTGLLGICGVGHECKNAPVAQLAEACKVDNSALNGCEIHLEVSCVDNYSRRSVDSKTHSVGDRVVYVDKFNCHAAHFNGLSGSYNVQLCLAQKIMLLELALDKTDGKTGGINGDIHLFQQICKSADVVLMTVGDNDASYLVDVLLNIGEIGDNKVNARHIAVWESKTAVNDEHIVSALENGHVLAYLVKSAQGDYSKGCALYSPVVGVINNVLILFLGSSLLIVPVIVSGLISSLLIVVLYLLILSAVGLALLIALFKSGLFKGKGLSGYLSYRSVILLAGSLIILVIVLVVRLIAVRSVAVLLLIFLTGLFGCFRIYIIVIIVCCGPIIL